MPSGHTVGENHAYMLRHWRTASFKSVTVISAPVMSLIFVSILVLFFGLSLIHIYNTYFKDSIPLLGYRFNFVDVLKTFVVKQYGHYTEYKGVDKTSIRLSLIHI